MARDDAPSLKCVSSMPRSAIRGWVIAASVTGAIALLSLVTFAFGRRIAYGLPHVFLIGAPALGAIGAAACAWRRSAALKWGSFSLALVFWAGGAAGTAVIDVFDFRFAHFPDLETILYFFYGVPLAFIVASPANEVWYVRLVDAVLALVLGIVFFACSAIFAPPVNRDPNEYMLIRTLLDLQNIFIALFAFVRFRAARTGEEEDFFRVLAWFAGVYMIAAAYMNHVHFEVQIGTPLDLIIEAPFLLVIFMTLRRFLEPAPSAQPAESSRSASLVRIASPIMLPITIFTISCSLVFRAPWLGVAGFLSALAGYGARNILLQWQALGERARLDRLAKVDVLTELANRRQFDETLASEFRRAERRDNELALLMVDIDHFKAVNDTYGHIRGDDYLRAVGQALASCATRSGDLVARYGGEEFAVILPATDVAAGARIAERMRDAVAALALPGAGGADHVTISIGLASVTRSGARDPAQLLAAADGALYLAKQRGRNRVELSHAPSPMLKPVINPAVGQECPRPLYPPAILSHMQRHEQHTSHFDP